ALGYEKEIHVYQPPEADPDTPRPTIYIHDGRDYIEFAHIPAVLDDLIRRGKIQPVNAVFVSPPNRHQSDMPNRTTEYGLNPKYVTFMADELVPFVDGRFPTIQRPDARMTVGDSYAGLVAASLVHARPDCFGLGYSQSGYVSCEDDTLIERYKTKPKGDIRLYVDVGIFERTVGKGWLPDDEIDFVEGNRRFRDVLQTNGYDFVYREYPEGHTWGNWRRHFVDGVIHFFGS
ncbi:MAG: alpha/beta hydrolase-fold protein, partial [Planctomycetota bacterium]